jgi:hypothetical protein
MCAAPGRPITAPFYGLHPYYSEPRILFDVPPGSFIPSPKVTSSVITLKLRTSPPDGILDEALFFRVVRASFAQRRKTLVNSLESAFGGRFSKDELRRIVTDCGFDVMTRGELWIIPVRGGRAPAGGNRHDHPKGILREGHADGRQGTFGQMIVRRTDEGETRGIIVETEAYLGEKDDAAHSYRGKSERVRVQYGPAGMAYIYLIYGMYNCRISPRGRRACRRLSSYGLWSRYWVLNLMKKRRRTDKRSGFAAAPVSSVWPWTSAGTFTAPTCARTVRFFWNSGRLRRRRRRQNGSVSIMRAVPRQALAVYNTRQSFTFQPRDSAPTHRATRNCAQAKTVISS